MVKCLFVFCGHQQVVKMVLIRFWACKIGCLIRGLNSIWIKKWVWLGGRYFVIKKKNKKTRLYFWGYVNVFGYVSDLKTFWILIFRIFSYKKFLRCLNRSLLEIFCLWDMFFPFVLLSRYCFFVKVRTVTTKTPQ